MIQQYFEDFRTIFPTTKYGEYPLIFQWIREQVQGDQDKLYDKSNEIQISIQSRFQVIIKPDMIARFHYLLWKIAHYKIELTDFVRYCELQQSLSELEARYRVQGKLCSVLQQLNQSKM